MVGAGFSPSEREAAEAPTRELARLIFGWVLTGRVRTLARTSLKLPRGEAPDVDVELVEARVVAVSCELNLELQFILRHWLLAYRARGTDARPSPSPIRCATR